MATKAAPETTSFHRYTDEQWVAIERILPPTNLLSWGRNVRFALEQIGREFCAMRDRRLRRPSAREHEQLRRCIARIESIRHPSLRRALGPSYDLMRAWDSLLEAWSSKGFQRRRDVHRELLYGRMIWLWEHSLGGRFGVSFEGPLARFLTAALGPILRSEMPGSDGIKALLQREKDSRRKR
jgi:hypothetical protein